MNLEHLSIPESGENIEPRKTRPGRIKKDPRRYPDSTAIEMSARMGNYDAKVPLKSSDATRGPHKDTWYYAMKA